LDESTGDKRAAAEDWAAYGRFLDEAGFPARLAYACVVKSESLARSLPDAALAEQLATVRKQFEHRAGADVAAVRRNPEPALREALALRR